MIRLQDIIVIIKTEALASGFKTISEVIVNEKDSSDTELPKMYIKLDKIMYTKLQINAMIETYDIKLLMVVKEDDTPITTLKTIKDLFMKNLLSNSTIEFKNLINQVKISFIESTLTNDVVLKNKVGGQSLLLSMLIENVNNLGS